MQPISFHPIGIFTRKVAESNLVMVNRYPPAILYKNPLLSLHTP